MTDSGPITPGNVGFMKQPTHAKALREMFDAGWKAAARFCDRDDAVADGIVGFDACSQFESAFAEALRDQRAGVATPAAPAQPGQERGDLPPLPDADLRDVGTTSQEIRDFLRGYATEYARTALAARAAPQPAVTASAQEPDGFGSADHWKEKAQYWAGVAHKLRGQALRGEPVDGIIQPPTATPAAEEPAATVIKQGADRQCIAGVRSHHGGYKWFDAAEHQPVSAVELDAARYRWLRAYLLSNDTQYDDALVAARNAEELDAVIDAANAAQRATHQGEHK